MTEINSFNPKDYKLPLTQFMQLSGTLAMNEASALSDFKTFKKHPEHFSKNLETGVLEYDATLSVTLDWVMQDRRNIMNQMRSMPQLNDMPDEWLAQIEPSAGRLIQAENQLKEFFAAATRLLCMRYEETKPDEFAAAFNKLPAQLQKVQNQSTFIPETCIRNCETIFEALQAIYPPEKQWQAKIDFSTRQALTAERPTSAIRQSMTIGRRE